MSDIKRIETEDGSHSLYVPDLQETYHSHHGAVVESRHVFIEKGLRYFRVKAGLPERISVLEIGMGTGLNALLSYQFVKEMSPLHLHYTTLEPYPLPRELWGDLNYAQKIGAGDWQSFYTFLHESHWDDEQDFDAQFRLEKLQQKLEDYAAIPESEDVVFFDAFAPNKQAELWQLPLLEKCFTALRPGGVWVTYSARGQLKRDLKSLGFQVETLPGPPGKKEMVRAEKPKI